jgi:hypothetical protein
MRAANAHDPVGFLEERFSERDHLSSLRIPQISRIQIAEPRGQAV